MFPSRGKSRSRTPTPAPTSTPTSPEESFIWKKFSTLHRGDVKTLAASTVAVASSIGSPSLNQSHHPRSDEQNAAHTSEPDLEAIGQGSGSHRAADSAWKTAYSTARMVIEITKESSDMFLPLKAVVGALSVLIRNYDQTVSNAKQVEEIEERMLSLSDILRSPLREGDHLERARRELLCMRLMDVLEGLEPLSEQKGLSQFLRNEDHAGLLNGFVQDVDRAVTDYQTSLQQSTYENTKDIDQTTKGIAENTADIVHKAREITEATDLETLDKLNPVRNAGYQAEHHERCLTGTRESILEDIMRWAQNTRGQPVYWLNGLAGTGKSTIAQTFSKMASDHDILGASFFCSREYLYRKDLKNIFPTLAYQLACHYPRFRDHLVKVIKRDPSVAHNSPISQLRDLLVDPLSATGISCVIVIDALDECVDDQPASAILSVLGRLVSKPSLVKFFIAGRPEPRIRSGFRLPLLKPFTQVFLLHEVGPASVGGDIRLYLTKKLTGIAKRRSDLDLPEVWPSDRDITVLVKKSSGLFIFASMVARFIESEHHDPRERLQLIVSNAEDTSYEGASGIDLLYSQVLHDAFLGIEEESVFIDLKRILSTVVLALNPLSRDGLAQLLDIDPTVIPTRLRHLHSVILVPADGSKEIRIFHKSFPDFLQDPERCRDPRFHIDCQTRHGDMALSCLRLVRTLKMNPCGLPPFVMNADISDRPQRMEELGGGLRYACEYWSTHFLLSSSSREYSDQLTVATSQFFNDPIFPWMEIMSIEGHLEGVIHSMNHLSEWLDKVHLRDNPLHGLTKDCLRFILHFFQPIHLSAQHIYHTALPLSPETSILRQRFLKNHPSWKEDLTTQQVPSLRIPTTWGPILRTIKADSGSFMHMTVAGGRIIAACGDNTINVYDAVTGVLRLSLNPPQQVTKVEGSPDGSVLFFAHRRAHAITVWDTQTGGLNYTLTTTSEISDIAVSSKGKYLGSCSSDGTLEFWKVGSRCGGLYFLAQAVVCICWLEPEDQVALALERSIVVLEVTTGRMLHTWDVGGSLRKIAFSVHQHRLAVLLVRGAEGKITTIDIRTGAVLESSYTPHDISSLTFSNDGDRVICATNVGNLLSHTPRYSSGWYHYLTHLGAVHSMSLLRGGHLAVGSGESIQLLELEHLRPSGASQDPEIARVYWLDTEKAICGSSRDHRDVYLLDMAATKTLTHHHIKVDEFDAAFTPRFLCASFDHAITILSLRKPDSFALRQREVGWDYALWEQLSSRPVLLGAISPGGQHIITICGGEDPTGDGDWELCVRGAVGSSGDILDAIPFNRKGGPPRKIVFTSEDHFYIEERLVFSAPPRDEDVFKDRVQRSSNPPTTFKHPSLHPQELDVRHTSPHIRKPVARRPDEITTSTTGSESQPRTGVHHKEYIVQKTFSLKTNQTPPSRVKIEEVPGEEILPVFHPYSLDENLEWVVDNRSRRVCWLPPGYGTRIEDGHFFVGSSIVMAGRDGIIRKLTFREPRSDS